MNESAQYGLYNPGVLPSGEQRLESAVLDLRADVCLLRDDIRYLRELITNNKCKCSQKPRPCKKSSKAP